MVRTTMKEAPFSLLRLALAGLGETQESIGDHFNPPLCRPTISSRFTGKSQWKLNEMYDLLDMIGASHSDMHIYFPQGGKMNKETLLKRPGNNYSDWRYNV